MSQTGVLILQPSRFEIGRFFQLVKACSKHVENVLYIDFNLNANPSSDPAQQTSCTFSRTEMYKVLEGIYKSRAQELNNLDIRVLLDNESNFQQKTRVFSQRLDVGFLESSYKSEQSIVEKACMKYNFKNGDSMQFLDGISEPNISEGFGHFTEEMKSYETVAVGGTFDRYAIRTNFKHARLDAA